MTTKTVQCSTLVGDGSTDNADLLQSCADSNAPAAVPNQIVYLAAPAGTFRVSHGVVLHTGEILLGSGASSSEVIGDQPNSELQPLFTIPQYSGIAGLTIKAPGASLIGTSDLSGNPATSGHVFLANLVLDSTSSDLANNPATMVALSGPDIQVYGSSFFSGTHVGLGVQQGDGIVISGDTFINDWAYNYVESSQNTIFESNTGYAKRGTGNPGGPGGAVLSLARPFCDYCQSMVTRNEYVGHNMVRDMGANDNQIFLMDGGAGAYYGPIASSTADTVVLGNDPSWVMTGTGDPQGLSMVIVMGTGVGQQSFLKSVSGRTITLSTPWKVVPDSTSTVVINAMEPNMIFANNTITDTLGTAFLLYHSVDSVVEDNNITNSGLGIMLLAQGPYGGQAAFPPLINTDVLRNKIEDGSGNLILTAPLRNVSGVGIFNGYGTMISGMMIRDNTVSPTQTIFSTNGEMGINANVIERNRAYWVDPAGMVPGFLVQNNVTP
jgi:hypothetical protein